MVESVCDLKIGDIITTQIYSCSQKYFHQLEIEKETFGEDSDEYKLAEKEYDNYWGQRKGTLIQIGECFAECIILTEDNKKIPMINNMVGKMGHWNEKEISGGKYFVSIERS